MLPDDPRRGSERPLDVLVLVVPFSFPQASSDRSASERSVRLLHGRPRDRRHHFDQPLFTRSSSESFPPDLSSSFSLHGNTSQPPCLSDLSISSSPRDGRGDGESRDEQGGWDVRVDRGEDGEVESDDGDGERRRSELILVEDRIGWVARGSSREVEGGGGLGARWREGIRSTVPSC